MFNINDTVLYGSHGACRVIDITEKEFCGKIGLYYILEPMFDDRCTFFVSTDNELAAAHLRPVLPEPQVRQLIRDMPATAAEWIDNPKLRKARYGQIIANGDRRELIALIKALHDHQLRQQASGKKLNMSDEQSLKTAEKMLYHEIALALDLPPEQVVPFIVAQLG